MIRLTRVGYCYRIALESWKTCKGAGSGIQEYVLEQGWRITWMACAHSKTRGRLNKQTTSHSHKNLCLPGAQIIKYWLSSWHEDILLFLTVASLFSWASSRHDLTAPRSWNDALHSVVNVGEWISMLRPIILQLTCNRYCCWIQTNSGCFLLFNVADREERLLVPWLRSWTTTTPWCTTPMLNFSAMVAGSTITASTGSLGEKGYVFLLFFLLLNPCCWDFGGKNMHATLRTSRWACNDKEGGARATGWIRTILSRK